MDKTSGAAGKLQRNDIQSIGIEDDFQEKTAYGKKEHEEMLAAKFETEAATYINE